MNEEKETILNQGNTKEKGKKGVGKVLILLILLVAIIAGAIYYCMIYTKPEEAIKRTIGKAVSSYQESIQEENYKTIKATIGASLDLDLEDESQIDKDVVELINDLDLSLNVQMDKDQKQMVTKLEADYENKDLLDVAAFIDAKEEKSYVYLKDLFDKYIEVDMESEVYDSLIEVFETSDTSGKQATIKKATSILQKEIKNMVKEEYCSSEKQEITLGDKKVKVTKNTISMTGSELKKELTTLCTNLKNNKEFLECYENQDEITESLEDLIDALDDMEIDDANIKFSIYNSGITQKCVKMDLEVKQDEEAVLFELTKKDEGSYEFKVSEGESNNAITLKLDQKDKENYEFQISSSKEDEKIEGNINIKKENDKSASSKIEVKVPEFGKVALTLKCSYELDTEIDKVDSDKTIKQEKMTQEDMNKILENLQETKLFELINKFSGTALPSGSTSGSTSGSQTNTNTTTNTNDDSKKLATNSNEIITYSEDQKIEFKVPSGYEVGYQSDNYKAFDKDDISVKVTSEYGNIEQYLESIDSSKEYYEEQEYYKDVKLSELKTMNVDGREFSYKILEYKYDLGSKTYNYRNIYFCSKISSKNLAVVEIRDTGEMTESEIKEFLTMKVTDM